MWKVTRKGLMAHKVRFLLTGLAVILGVAFMTGTSVLTATVQATFNDLFADIYRNTDAVVRSADSIETDFGEMRGPIPATLVDTVRAVDGVEAVAGNVQIQYAQIVDAEGDAVGNPGQGPPALGFNWIANDELNPFHLVEGHAPENAEQIVIDRRSANDANLAPGDRLKILTQEAPKEYDLVGVARFGSADSPAGASIVLFQTSEAQRLAGKVGAFDEILSAAAPGVSQQQLKANLDAVLEPEVEAVTGAEITKENQELVQDQLGFFSTALSVFAWVALIVGAFVIYNTFAIVVAQRLREMALLRAVGATRRQVLTSVFVEAIVVGILASAVGVAVGSFLAIGLKAAMSGFGFDIPGRGVVVEPRAVIVGLLAGLAVTVLSAVVPARRASRIPPVAAMRDVALERPARMGLRGAIGGVMTMLGIVFMSLALLGDAELILVPVGMILILAGVFVLSPLFARGAALVLGRPLSAIKGVTGNLARENAARSPRRTATTAAAVMIAVSLVGALTIFAASANKSISRAIDGQFKTDLIITSGPGFGGSGLSPELGRAIAARPEVEAMTPLRFALVEVDGSGAFLGGVDPVAAAELFDFGDVAGGFRDVTDNGLAISQRKADEKNFAIGDSLPVRWAKTGTVSMTVEYIYDENGVAGDFNTSLGAFEKNASEQLDMQLFVKLAPGVTAEEGRAAIAPLLEPYPTAQLKDNAQYKEDQKAQINQILGLFYVLLFLAVVIALIGIANTMSLSVIERTRELGLLRAVGTSRGQLRSTIRWEAVIIAILGVLLGLVIAIFFAWAFVEALRDEGFTDFLVPVGQLALIVILFGVLAVLMAILPARRAAKLDVLKAIATE